MKASIRFLFALIFIIKLASGQRRINYCYELDDQRPQRAFFSSKTSYSMTKRPETDEHFFVQNCNPTKILIYMRHGTRLPKAEEINRYSQLDLLKEEIIANYAKRANDILCELDMNLLKNWHWDRNITENFDAFLTSQGWNEIRSVAVRYQQLFPNILENVYDAKKFLFRHTDTQRTEASLKAFVEGLFGSSVIDRMDLPSGEESKKLLKPYIYCPLNTEEITGAGTEYDQFMNSQIITRLVSDVSERLSQTPLNTKQVFDMYNMCIYEQAWNPHSSSPWCAAFTPDQFYDLEYPEDLRNYYINGNGRKTNKRLMCSLVNDMLDHLKNNDQPQAVAYFTHSSSLLLFLTSLQAFKDDVPLRADNYQNTTQRKCRTSETCPFASNLAVVKYDCPNDIDQEKVKFFLNENQIEFEWCNGGLCDLRDIQERYKEFTQADCDKYFCSAGAVIKISGFLLASFIFVIALITNQFY